MHSPKMCLYFNFSSELILHISFHQFTFKHRLEVDRMIFAKNMKKERHKNEKF